MLDERRRRRHAIFRQLRRRYLSLPALPMPPLFTLVYFLLLPLTFTLVTPLIRFYYFAEMLRQMPLSDDAALMLDAADAAAPPDYADDDDFRRRHC